MSHQRCHASAYSLAALLLFGGACIVLLPGCPITPPGGCTTVADCDDSDPCTTDTCDSTGQCVHEDITDCPGVGLTASVSGNAVPGGTLSATVDVDIRDGSTVESYAWSQSNSVTVTLSGESTATATVTLPGATAYKDELITVLREPPIGADELPENVPLPEGEFPGGLQDRFQVVGVNPFALEEAGLITLEVTVTTTSGTYTASVDVHTHLPWPTSPGLLAVPVDKPVLLHGKTQGSYNWALARPGGSSATLTDATSQSPYFTPDVTGTYTVTVTDQTVDPAATVTLAIIAGTWEGVITGQDAEGRPLAAGCTICHNDGLAPDKFTPWAQTGHAEIFSVNLDTSTHYGESCFSCHTVGFDPDSDNGGVDEAADYDTFLAAGLLNNPGDNWTTMLANYPDTAQLSNIQCENCHGPQNGAHMAGEPRMSLSSDVCAVCHGEPLRHARFQQWQLSGHANYELAIDEGESGSCARCHTVNGFLAWLEILLDNDPATDPLADVDVTWTAEETHPQTCVTCHDPHNIGTTTGEGTDAVIRISGDTPPLIAGFQVQNAGRGAICMTCHNSRRGLRNDNTFDATVADGDAARAPHGSAQTDVLMGENAYLVTVGTRSPHSLVQDSCVRCHMEDTPPPDLLAYNLGGTNHTFFAAPDICGSCHTGIQDATAIQTAFQANADQLEQLIEDALLSLIGAQIDAGRRIDLNGEATITDVTQIAELQFGESHGRQAITVTLTDSSVLGPYRISDVDVLSGATSAGNLYDFADAALIKAGWNWILANNDGSKGVHHPTFVTQMLNAAIAALNGLAAG